MINLNSKDFDVVILCGGKGLRLGDLTKNIPKPMIKINGKPFLEIIIKYVSSFGFKRFILCAGYKKEVIRDYFGSFKNKLDLEISGEEEDRPLGTGGAVSNAKSLIKSRNLLVLNGDSFIGVDLKEFLNFHLSSNALVSMVLTSVSSGRNDAGIVRIDKNNKITSFNEKSYVDKKGFINAGIYAFKNDVFSFMPKKEKFSLEYDFFPSLVGKKLLGYVIDKEIIDIGSPERLKCAEDFFGDNFKI